MHRCSHACSDTHEGYVSVCWSGRVMCICPCPCMYVLTHAPYMHACMQVFHAGTSLNAAGEVVSSGGRVLNVTALGKDVAEAQANAYQAVKQIEWADAYYRSDIGWRAIARMKSL